MVSPRNVGMTYSELNALSNFSFLHGASHPEEIVFQAAAYGYRAVCVADYHSFAGIVRGHSAAKEAGIRYVVGTRLRLGDCFEAAAYPRNREAYGRLCALLSKGNLRAEKGRCILHLEDVLEAQKEVLFTVIPPSFLPAAAATHDMQIEKFTGMLEKFREGIDDRKSLSLAVSFGYRNREKQQVEWMLGLSKRFSLPLIASTSPAYHRPGRKALQDVLTCIRTGTPIQKAGFLLMQNAERCLKPVSEIERLFRHFPESIERTQEVADAARFSLDELRYEYPHEICPSNTSPHEYLSECTWEGARARYPDGIPEKVSRTIGEELSLIKELAYEHYFLTCRDIVRFARERGILCQGRGAAANSAVCYCLGITAVDPARIDLLFARFVSKERNEPPDIDIDFEHERREEVIQYIYEKYGRNRAGIVSEVVTYRHRGAMRETAKALGYSLAETDKLAKLIHRWNGCEVPVSDLKEAGFSPDDARLRACFAIAEELVGFPRHLSQHVGGFIICEKLLSETVPILNAAMEDRTIIEWNKDDIELLGMLKIDVLALGMLTCVRKALALINDTRPQEPPIEFHTVPPEDPDVYEMISRADTLGVFQIESRAQMSMLPRLRPQTFYDLVIEVAIVRPGPIHGNMVHPYLRRRHGLEPISYPDKRVEDVLHKTLGVPLFQEQAMKLAMVVAGFTSGEAEQLRRAMAAWKSNKETIAKFKERIVSGMVGNKFSREYAEICFNQMKGFSEYGFPESHAASFALIVYVSAWIKCRYPAQFAAALLNSQPMGFYAPSQIIRDAIEHGVTIIPVDAQKSEWDCAVTHEGAVRLGFRLIKGIAEDQIRSFIAARSVLENGWTIKELYTTAHLMGLPLMRKALSLIGKADGFRELGLSPREALWQTKALPISPGMLDGSLIESADPLLKGLTRREAMFLDYDMTGFSLKAHPIGLIRELLPPTVIRNRALGDAGNKSRAAVCGIAICRQRPSTSKGVVFITLEDETGIANLIIKPRVYDEFRKIITLSTCMKVSGVVEKTREIIHLVVDHLECFDSYLAGGNIDSFPSRSYSY